MIVNSCQEMKLIPLDEESNLYTYYSNDFSEIFQGCIVNGKKNGYGKFWGKKYNYHGHWKDDRPHGHGYYKWKGNISELDGDTVVEYDGEWNCGERDGTGKEVYINCEFYIGGIKNNSKHGKGIYYSSNGKIKYDIEWDEGKPVGKGVIRDYHPNGSLKYCGGFKDNYKYGEGVEYYENGKVKYEGVFDKDVYEGDGILYYPSGRKHIEGKFKEGYCHGEFKSYFDNESNNVREVGEMEMGSTIRCQLHSEITGKVIYDGEAYRGKFHGDGILYYKEGNKKYEGGFEVGVYHGKGVEFYKNGRVMYDGEFKKGYKEGRGMSYYEFGDQVRYDGDWIKGRRDGQGTLYYKNGHVSYEGDWVNDYRHGQGASRYESTNNMEYLGEWQHNERNGDGCLFDENGNLIYQGRFVDNDMAI